ncbi:MAG: glutathione S-transferase [Gammaproteobacteria bacterium]|nr:MAG: glutathione S-transferase [Gammaproteobacteria bacterium]RKZ69926.1 MAG: glutathione S-transferase [Gammaproteobacteria bacterium]
MQATPVLYSFRRCPYAIRARMALKYASIDCELREIVLSNKPQAMINLSNKGTVPILHLTDGSIIDESLEVMLWALEQADPDNWLDIENEHGRLLIKKNDQEFKQYLDKYKYFQRYPEHTQLYYRKQAEEFIELLENMLQEHHGLGLVSNQLSLADVAIFPFVRQFAHVDLEWFSNSQYRNLISWLTKFEENELFLAVMNKYKPWQENEDVIPTHINEFNNQERELEC